MRFICSSFVWGLLAAKEIRLTFLRRPVLEGFEEQYFRWIWIFTFTFTFAFTYLHDIDIKFGTRAQQRCFILTSTGGGMPPSCPLQITRLFTGRVPRNFASLNQKQVDSPLKIW